MLDRRRFAVGVSATGFLGLSGRALAESPTDAFSRIEKESGGRLGVAALDTRNGRRLGHRMDERCAMCSTFKLLAAGTVLARVDAGKEKLDRLVRFTAADVLSYAPIAKDHVATGMTVAALCEAAITVSDNTAANLLLASFGGPRGLTAFVRTLGDNVTRLDRIETALNEAVPGDPRDTTTPTAMLADIQALVLGNALSEKSREQLKQWLLGNKTGAGRLRAGVPQGWIVADKTGTGEHGTNNDVGVLYPPGRPPIVVTVYVTQSDAPEAQRIAAIAAAGKAVAAAFA
jgi:beta-lactamase class A